MTQINIHLPSLAHTFCGESLEITSKDDIFDSGDLLMGVTPLYDSAGLRTTVSRSLSPQEEENLFRSAFGASRQQLAGIPIRLLPLLFRARVLAAEGNNLGLSDALGTIDSQAYIEGYFFSPKASQVLFQGIQSLLLQRIAPFITQNPY